MSQLQETMSDLLSHTATKMIAACVALGAVPFYLLSMATATLTN